MGVAMRADRMAGLSDPAHSVGISVDFLSGQKEGRLDAVSGQNRQHPGCVLVVGTIVKGQRDLVIGQRGGV